MNGVLPTSANRTDAGTIDAWVRIELKRKDGTLNELFPYWILGHGARNTEPRWSVVRNVLGWVD